MGWTYKAPTVKRLSEFFDEDTARELRKAMKAPSCAWLIENYVEADRRERECFHSPERADLIMHVCDVILGTHGVEYIESPDADWGSLADYAYCNTGDMYAATIMFDYSNQRFIVNDWASVAERNKRR